MTGTKTGAGTSRPEGRKRDRAETERKLREAAVQVFSKYGFDAATTKLVAQTAGINEALINRYFNGKNGLLLAIMQDYVAEQHEKDLGYPPCDSLEEEILQFCLAKINEAKVEERGHMMRIVLSRVAVDEEIRAYLTKELQVIQGNPRLVAHLERLQQLGRIPKQLDVKLIATTVDGQVFAALMFGHLIFGLDIQQVTARIKHFAQVYARGLLAG